MTSQPKWTMVEADLSQTDLFADYAKACFDVGIEKYRKGVSEPLMLLEEILQAKTRLPDLIEHDYPTTTYFLLASDGRLAKQILGAIRLRRGDSEFINNVIGHIGFETHPDARSKGVAKFMLSWVCQHVISEPVIVTCNVNNIASKRVIEHCGGRFLSVHTEPKRGDLLRFKCEPDNRQ